ncbi:MAG TPA: hypothetical protein VHP58_00365 [Alphaproteobacteria bacterium]|nr:hypothetical protein [Alphaproteobacteria bacterium]
MTEDERKLWTDLALPTFNLIDAEHLGLDTAQREKLDLYVCNLLLKREFYHQGNGARRLIPPFTVELDMRSLEGEKCPPHDPEERLWGFRDFSILRARPFQKSLEEGVLLRHQQYGAYTWTARRFLRLEGTPWFFGPHLLVPAGDLPLVLQAVTLSAVPLPSPAAAVPATA